MMEKGKVRNHGVLIHQQDRYVLPSSFQNPH